MEEVSKLLSQIRVISSNADDATRIKIADALVETVSAIQTPTEYIMRISGSHLQTACARFGIDLGLFRHLASTEESLRLATLSEKFNADEVLLRRLLRYMASIGQVKETGKDEFAANNVTKYLATPTTEFALYHLFDNHGPTFQDLPEFLKENRYQNITDQTNTVFQKSFNTDLPSYAWLLQHPKPFSYLQEAMKLEYGGDWLSVFDLEKEMGEWSGASDPERALFVDVGGGMGHQSIRLREKFPNAPGRVIVQDLPQAIERIPKPMPHGIEAMGHNFFEPEPIKGAKFYYMRMVLHGDPDEKCLTILKNVIDVMDSESRLIIDDVVLPNEGVHWQAAMKDIMMMTSMAAMKRTQDQWYSLLDAAGLKILDIRSYTWPNQDSVIIAVPK